MAATLKISKTSLFFFFSLQFKQCFYTDWILVRVMKIRGGKKKEKLQRHTHISIRLSMIISGPGSLYRWFCRQKLSSGLKSQLNLNMCLPIEKGKCVLINIKQCLISVGLNQIRTMSEPRATEKKNIYHFFPLNMHKDIVRIHTHIHTHITLNFNQCRIFLSVTADYQHWRHMQCSRL